MNKYERSLFNDWRTPEVYRPAKPSKPRKAIQVSTDAEKRLERLETALLEVIAYGESFECQHDNHVPTHMLRKILRESK